MNKLIKQILSPIGIPIDYGTYLGTANEFIVFNVWSVPMLHADDKEIGTNYTVQIDIFSPNNLLKIANEVNSRMINAGFMRILDDPVEYLQDKKLYRKTFRFSYAKEVE